MILKRLRSSLSVIFTEVQEFDWIMERDDMKRVEIKNPNESCLGTKCIIDGKSIPNVRSVDFHVGVGEIPEFTFKTNGIPDIDVMGRVVIDPSPTNLQEACSIIANELKKHGEFYDAYKNSVLSVFNESRIAFSPYDLREEIAEKVVKRISGEE